MSEKIEVKSNQIGFCGLLAILFIGLKLGHVIDWSWWWVLSPLWLPISIVIAICLGILLFAGFVWMLAVIFDSATKAKKPKKYRGL